MGAKSYLLTAFVLTIIETILGAAAMAWMWMARAGVDSAQGGILTGFSSHLGARLRDWADRQAEAGCYTWAALSSSHSKTR